MSSQPLRRFSDIKPKFLEDAKSLEEVIGSEVTIKAYKMVRFSERLGDAMILETDKGKFYTFSKVVQRQILSTADFLPYVAKIKKVRNYLTLE
ncbi:hypothetical protein [Archaeal virus sp.]|nr:hypothetical protein [Archaeal virus sp.]